MKSLLIMATVAATAILLSGCRDKKPEPVPGPQSALHAARDAARNNTALSGWAGRHHGVSEISWFQGTLEEAFSGRTPNKRSSGESRTLFLD
jgi:hypothetical protein